MLIVDKTRIIQDALAVTGNNILSQEDDDPDTWQVASMGYDRAIRRITVEHNWSFATTSIALASILVTSPSRRYSRAFALPTDALQIVGLTVDYIAQDVSYQGVENAYPITDFEIVDGKLCTNRTDVLYLKYLRLVEPEVTHPLFVEVLTLLVEASILRGVNEDFGEASNREKTAEFRLSGAKARIDMQTPGRCLRKSRLQAARFRRRG